MSLSLRPPPVLDFCLEAAGILEERGHGHGGLHRSLTAALSESEPESAASSNFQEGASPHIAALRLPVAQWWPQAPGGGRAGSALADLSRAPPPSPQTHAIVEAGG